MWYAITSEIRSHRKGISQLMSIFLLAFFVVTTTAQTNNDKNTHTNNKPYLVGVFPFVSLSRIENIFSPILINLKFSLERDMQIRSSKSYEKFVERLEKKTFDIAFIQPFDYVKTAEKAGYKPLLARTSPLSAILVVPANSPVSDISDLKGKIIALPPKGAAVSYLAFIIWYKAGKNLESESHIKHVRSHDSCLQHLLIGQASACVTAKVPMKLFEKKSNVNFRVIAESPTIPSALFVTHPEVTEHERSIIKDTLITYVNSSTNTFWSTYNQGASLKSVADKDYDSIRQYLRYIEDL